MVLGRFVTYKFVSFIWSPDGRANDTCNEWDQKMLGVDLVPRRLTFNLLLRSDTPFKVFMACCAPSSLTKFTKPYPKL